MWDKEDEKANPDGPVKVIMKDVSKQLIPEKMYKLLSENYDEGIQQIAHSADFYDVSPIQPIERLPKEYENIQNGHNGTHHFLIDDFCRAYETRKLSPTNIWEVARWNIPGLLAHQSALQGGKPIDVIDLGNPPEDWEVLGWE